MRDISNRSAMSFYLSFSFSFSLSCFVHLMRGEWEKKLKMGGIGEESAKKEKRYSYLSLSDVLNLLRTDSFYTLSVSHVSIRCFSSSPLYAEQRVFYSYLDRPAVRFDQTTTIFWTWAQNMCAVQPSGPLASLFDSVVVDVVFLLLSLGHILCPYFFLTPSLSSWRLTLCLYNPCCWRGKVQ